MPLTCVKMEIIVCTECVMHKELCLLSDSAFKKQCGDKVCESQYFRVRGTLPDLSGY